MSTGPNKELVLEWNKQTSQFVSDAVNYADKHKESFNKLLVLMNTGSILVSTNFLSQTLALDVGISAAHIKIAWTLSLLAIAGTMLNHLLAAKASDDHVRQLLPLFNNPRPDFKLNTKFKMVTLILEILSILFTLGGLLVLMKIAFSIV